MLQTELVIKDSNEFDLFLYVSTGQFHGLMLFFSVRGDALVLQSVDLPIFYRILDNPEAMARSQVGTPYFMSPEILKGVPYNFKVVHFYFVSF